MNRSYLALAALALFGMSATAVSAAEVIDVYKSPSCGCCGKWIDHMKDAGFEVRAHNVMDVPEGCCPICAGSGYANQDTRELCHTCGGTGAD